MDILRGFAAERSDESDQQPPERSDESDQQPPEGSDESDRQPPEGSDESDRQPPGRRGPRKRQHPQGSSEESSDEDREQSASKRHKKQPRHRKSGASKQGSKRFMSHACKYVCECAGAFLTLKTLVCIVYYFSYLLLQVADVHAVSPHRLVVNEVQLDPVFAARTELVITQAEQLLTLLLKIVRFQAHCRGHEGRTCLKNYKMKMNKRMHSLSSFLVCVGVHQLMKL